MIIKLEKEDNEKITILENTFPQIFLKSKIKNDFENNPFSNYIIYVIDNKIIGFINYTLIYEKSEIVNFNIVDSYQHQGYGSQLLSYLIDELKACKIENITLEVRCNNINAIKMYQKYGFEKRAIRSDYYKDEDGILMELKL